MLDALLELQNVIFNETIDENEEKTIEQVANKYNVNKDDIIPYFNLFALYKFDYEANQRSIQGRRIWTKSERALIQAYINDQENKQTKSRSLKDLGKLLEPTKRTVQSIQFEYYNNIAKKKVKTEETRDEKIVEVKKEKQIEKIDLLTELTSFVQNAGKLENFDVAEFFKGINALTSLAVNKIENTEKTSELENQIMEKEKVIQSLEAEVNKLKNDIEGIRTAIEQFNALDGMDKIINLQEYSSKLRYMVDKFGNVVTIKE